MLKQSLLQGYFWHKIIKIFQVFLSDLTNHDMIFFIEPKNIYLTFHVRPEILAKRAKQCISVCPNCSLRERNLKQRGFVEYKLSGSSSLASRIQNNVWAGEVADMTWNTNFA